MIANLSQIYRKPSQTDRKPIAKRIAKMLAKLRIVAGESHVIASATRKCESYGRTDGLT